MTMRFNSLHTATFLILAGVISACGGTGPAPDWLPPAEDRHTAWQDWRTGKDSLFITADSPIPEDERPGFRGLQYFPFDSTLAFPVALEPVLSADTLRITTTTGQIRPYVRYGRLTFQLGGRIQHLTAYRGVGDTEGHGSVFVPFTDPTNRTDTFGGGRYLDLRADPQGRYVIDFNYAYSPYCAYDPRWSCPIPPPENRLSAPVRAGEQYRDGERVWTAGR